jgi:L-lysine 2,3-aminomutase
MAGVLSRGVITYEGYICEPQTLSKGLFAICILPFYVFQLQLVKFIKNRIKIQKYQAQFCCAQCNKNYNFLQRCIYF